MLETLVIGAGQAGLAASHHLSRAGVDHVVLERGRIGETWRTQRWDSFALNTPGRGSVLPGDLEGPSPADGFAGRDAYVAYLQAYAGRAAVLPQTGVSVSRVRRRPDGSGFDVSTDVAGELAARTVIVAAGAQRVPRLPAMAADLPADVTQLHSSAYRNPDQLPAGAVLVVGGAQSGVQIVEDLLDAGRSVHLATSRVARMRRRYRGRDIFDWLFEIGFFDQTLAMLPNPAMEFAPLPMISGLGPLGHTVSLQWLVERGVSLLGRLAGLDHGRLAFDDDLGANIAWADARSAEVSHSIDAAIASKGLNAPPPEPDPVDQPYPDPSAVHGPTSLDLVAAGISTVVWTTGVTGDLSFLPDEALGPGGHPIQRDGKSGIPGLWYLGLPWQRNRASGIIAGTVADAPLLVGQVKEYLAGG